MAGNPVQSEQTSTRAVFSAAFAPRLLGLHYPSAVSGNGGRLEAQFLHFDRPAGGFRERKAGIWLSDGRIERIDPPVVTAREFHGALRRFLGEQHPADGSRRGQVPTQILRDLLETIGGGFSERTGDLNGAGVVRGVSTDRWPAQREFQESEGHPQGLMVLGRCHRRKGDFLGGLLGSRGDAAFLYTTGGLTTRINGDPNEDALGFDRIGDLDLYVVADAHHGARSSELAVRKFLELFRLGFEDEAEPTEDSIQTFLLRSVLRCHKTIQRDLNVGRSVTALLAALRAGRRVCWASVGDGLILRSGGNGIVRVNRDLGYGAAGRKSSIWLGDSSFRGRHVDYRCGILDAGGLLLATDGVLKHPRLRARLLAAQLGEAHDLETESRELARAYALEGPDNAALIYLRAAEPDASRGAS
ncbi:MAG: protein phosphatase 2C domain-containing protein [Candidatus Latescibacteria bacterium]|nr:protein phosphatase 2C domain-containing protein [Candidatus Latescibacterota bacterium]